ncbi:hypothetical protein PISMIDRAFT_15689 [Pisolithus microcarpus 441]|uniref:Clathrin/coatomer adaptor adaptin-like N-terminal domain-containing protein n=1 Tax=Pisolithus microcarpus 441 TaxID=765257 RepID=A0A0C9Z9M8_9AGAM|nr:adaptin N terminal region-domain-containing protein [Pisolithus microcarpus]KIK16613.1 hypothetical protein PISMIDRAFT_15689 [Pisolithus microcarpus 441]
MLGYDMNWASFHIIELMSSSKIHLKVVRYLVAAQSFDEDTDVLMLTTNLIKKDLSSIPTEIGPEVFIMLNHSHPHIRKRAVLTLYRVREKYPEALPQGIIRLQEWVDDPDPGVVSAMVNVICELARRNPQDYLPLASRLFRLLTILSNNWMLIKLIKLFGSLSPYEPWLVKKLQPPITVLISAMTTISLLYKCVHTCIIGNMLWGPSGLSLAQTCVSKLANRNHRCFKYIALLALVKIVPTHVDLVAEHQDVILASVDDDDISIRQQAQPAIHHSTTPLPSRAATNFNTICRPILSQRVVPSIPLKAPSAPSHSPAYRLVLSQHIISMCSDSMYDNVTDSEWDLSVLIDLTYISGIDVSAQIRNQLVNVVGRVRAVRAYAVKLMVKLLSVEMLLVHAGEPRSCLEVLWAAAWIYGEYCSELLMPEELLPYLLHSEVANLDLHTVAVDLQAATKVFGYWSTEAAQQWMDDLLDKVKGAVDSVMERTTGGFCIKPAYRGTGMGSEHPPDLTTSLYFWTVSPVVFLAGFWSTITLLMSSKETRGRDTTSGTPVPPIGLHLDAKEVVVFKALDPKVQERWRIQTQVKHALLGYAILDLVDYADSLVFGTWNPRLLQSKQVHHLLASFHADGLERFDLNTVIPIVIPKSNVEEASLTQDPSDPSKLSEMKLRLQTSLPGAQIKCAGGRHRVEALKLYLADIKAHVDQLTVERDNIAGTAEDELTEEDVHRHNNVLPDQIKRLGGIQQYGGQWMVAVYDEDLILKDGLELAQYLSRNETKHVYMETDEERVIMEIQYMATLNLQKRAARLVELRSSTGIRKKANKLVAILNSNPAFHAVEQLVQHGGHFMEMPEMNVRWLHSHLCGPYGGLLCAAIGVMAERLDICFGSCDLSHDEVDKLLNLRDTEDVDSIFQSTYTKLCEARQAGVAVKMRALLQSTSLLQIIDDAWKSHMSKHVLNTFMCMDEEEYVLPYEAFVSTAYDNIVCYVKTEEAQKEVPAHLRPLLDGFAAKFRFVCLNHTSPFYGLPILTQAPLRALASHFGRIQEALKEISRWFEPLVDYMVALSKSGTAPSYTQAAVDALRNHDRIKSDAPVRELLLQCILQNYGACLDVEIQLGSVSHTNRITSAKELAPLFPEKSLPVKSLPAPPSTGDASDAPTNLTPKLRPRKQPVAITQGNDMATQAELIRLRTHAAQLVKAMQSAVKPKDPLPLSAHMYRKTDGIHLVHRTSWGWRSASINSRLREFQNVAGSAVLEWGIIEEYRPQLLQEGSGAHYIRSRLIQLLRPWLKSAFFSNKQKNAEFSFADQVAHAPTSKEPSFQVAEVLPLLQSSLTLKSDTVMIQNLVKAVERCPLAWEDPDNEGDTKSPPLHSDVDDALRQLVKALEGNVFKRRACSDIMEEPSLPVIFRGTGDMMIIPKGKHNTKLLPQQPRRQAQDLSETYTDKENAGATNFASLNNEHPTVTPSDFAHANMVKSGVHQTMNPDTLDTPSSNCKEGPPSVISSTKRKAPDGVNGSKLLPFRRSDRNL